MRINITIDENLKCIAEQKAKSMGLTLSSLVRFLLAKETKGYRDKIDNTLLEIEQEGFDEPISFDAFQAVVRRDIKNAKG